MRKNGRARQLATRTLGVLPWQQEFWLLVTEHVLAKKPGPPNLLALEGFSAPALTQYTVTTPDLLRSFRKYNAGKPYHRQVRPFGFMVMFQQEDETEASTMMRVIAPFNRDPTKAARKAFDRDTGAVVRPKQLKTYAASLRTYYNHPEAKFLNGERGDRGPTRRRHIIGRSIVHIGKEANMLDIQSASGVDPDAQAEFCAISESRAERLKAIRAALKKLGPSRIARETDLSRQYLSKLAGGGTAPTDITLSIIEQAVAALEVIDGNRQREVDYAIAWLRNECERVGLRQTATEFELHPGHLSRIISGNRSLTSKLLRFLLSNAGDRQGAQKSNIQTA